MSWSELIRGGLTRAQRTKAALQTYRSEIDGAPWMTDDAEGASSLLSDILTDLMHYANADGLDFDDCLETARDHYEEEAK